MKILCLLFAILFSLLFVIRIKKFKQAEKEFLGDELAEKKGGLIENIIGLSFVPLFFLIAVILTPWRIPYSHWWWALVGIGLGVSLGINKFKLKTLPKKSQWNYEALDQVDSWILCVLSGIIGVYLGIFNFISWLSL